MLNFSWSRTFAGLAMGVTALTGFAAWASPSTQQAEDDWTRAQTEYSKKLSVMVAPKAADILKLKAEILDTKEKALQSAYEQDLKSTAGQGAASSSGSGPSLGPTGGYSGAAVPPSSSSGPTPAVILDGSTVQREIQYTAKKKNLKGSDEPPSSAPPTDTANAPASDHFETEISYPAKTLPGRVPSSK
ncbi:MAG: hypothetical protein H7222_13545 [Methylotenera sp.]|nr:hypothetical protein [Oligoflexia bacterium]